MDLLCVRVGRLLRTLSMNSKKLIEDILFFNILSYSYVICNIRYEQFFIQCFFLSWQSNYKIYYLDGALRYF